MPKCRRQSKSFQLLQFYLTLVIKEKLRRCQAIGILFRPRGNPPTLATSQIVYSNSKTKMKTRVLVFALFIFQLAYGQVNEENRNLVFDSADLKIIQRADSILSDSLKWNKQDDRECTDDIKTGNYSLYCALYEASIDITGQYVHRRPAMQIVRFTLEKYENGRVRNHRLMDWNNHPDTTFKEVKKVLQESIEAVKKQLMQRNKKP